MRGAGPKQGETQAQDRAGGCAGNAGARLGMGRLAREARIREVTTPWAMSMLHQGCLPESPDSTALSSARSSSPAQQACSKGPRSSVAHSRAGSALLAARAWHARCVRQAGARQPAVCPSSAMAAVSFPSGHAHARRPFLMHRRPRLSLNTRKNGSQTHLRPTATCLPSSSSRGTCSAEQCSWSRSSAARRCRPCAAACAATVAYLTPHCPASFACTQVD